MYTGTYLHTYMLLCTACIYTSTCKTHACAYGSHKYMCTYIHVCNQTQMYIYAPMYIHMYLTHTYISMHKCSLHAWPLDKGVDCGTCYAVRMASSSPRE